MNIQKLNASFNGYGRFSHRVVIMSRITPGSVAHYYVPDESKRQWIAIRTWLWERFGPSVELCMANPEFFKGQQPLWSWDIDKGSIYLQGEAYTMFMLKKEYWEDDENL